MSIGAISSIITILGATQGIYKWVTGTTISDQISEIKEQLNHIDGRIYLLEKKLMICPLRSCNEEDLFPIKITGMVPLVHMN